MLVPSGSGSTVSWQGYVVCKRNVSQSHTHKTQHPSLRIKFGETCISIGANSYAFLLLYPLDIVLIFPSCVWQQDMTTTQTNHSHLQGR